MRIRVARSQTQIGVTLAFVALFATSVYGQTAESTPGTLESQVERVKAENAALREQLLKIEEQQKELLELIRLSQPTNSTPPDGASSGSAGAEVALPPAVAAPTAPQQAISAANQTKDDRYKDGMVIWQTPEDAEVPFLLKFNINTQLL